MKPKRADFRPKKADLRADGANLRTERADFRPKKAKGQRHRMAGGGREWRNKIALCEIDGMFSPSYAKNLCTRSFLIIFTILLPRTKEIWDV